MTEIVPADGDRARELTEYLAGELARRGITGPGGAAPTVHVHYHAAPPAEAPAAPTGGQAALDRAVPYFIILLGGVVIVGGVGAVVVMLIPALLALAVTAAVIMGSFTVFALVIAVVARSLRQSKTEAKAASKLIDRARR